MEIEQQALWNFLQQTPPLDQLPESVLKNWLAAVEIEYYRQAETVLQPNQLNEWLYLVRSGSVQVLNSAGEQVNAVAEGEWFGYRSLLEKGKVQFSVKAQEDCLIYRFPGHHFLQAFNQYSIFQQFFARHKPVRIRLALQQWQQSQAHLPLDKPVKQFMRPVECLPLDTPLALLAQKLQLAEKDTQQPWPIFSWTDDGKTQFVQVEASLLVMALAKGVEKLYQLLPLKERYGLPQVLPTTLVGEVLPLLVKTESVLVMSEIGANRQEKPLGLFSLRQLPPALDFSALSHQIKQAKNFAQLQPVSEAMPAYFQQLVTQKLPPKKGGLAYQCFR